MNEKKGQDVDLAVYRVGRITLLQLMGLIALFGLVATWAVNRLFFVN